MKISDVIVGKRFRKELGDLESLKNSIQELGLLQPIIVDQNNNLLAGYRRLMACKELKIQDIPANKIEVE